MKKALLAVFIILSLSACRGLKTTGPVAEPRPTQGGASVEATIAEPGR